MDHIVTVALVVMALYYGPVVLIRALTFITGGKR